MSIRQHIPNTITSLNLLCGTAGTVFALTGRIDFAFYMMIAGAVADFCDGLSARALGAYSPMGKELDSLADQVSFGVLPSLMLLSVCSRAIGPSHMWPWICVLIAVFSGLRLAKFNIDERQSSSFIGLPTPACAMICGSGSYFLDFIGKEAAASIVGGAFSWVPIAVVVLCYLLVSEIPMFSFKFHKGDSLGWQRIAFLLCAAAAAAFAVIAGLNWSVAVFASFAAYILINFAEAFIKFVRE